MVYDADLAARMRRAIGPRPELTEKRMMGGVCFLLNGNMLGGAHRDKQSGDGFLMFRVGKENDAEVLERPEAIAMVQGKRRMGGLFNVHEDDCTDPVLDEWLALAISFAGSLPPKDTA